MNVIDSTELKYQDKAGLDPHKWRTLLWLALAELLVMSVWFSASAIIPALTVTWRLNEAGQAWLTMSVQIGYVIGALGSAVLNLADRIPARRLFSSSAFIAGLATLVIPMFGMGPTMVLILRFITGMSLAGVYPIGMKIMATWTKSDRGLGIGLLVGALTLGSASPHLLNAINITAGFHDWQIVLYLAAFMALIGGIISVVLVTEGPYHNPAPRFSWVYAWQILKKPEVLLPNLGYLGHMWELYAMWAWIAIFLQASFKISGTPQNWASLAAFTIIGIGGAGSLAAGKLADRWGRTLITIISMTISGVSALFVGLLFGGNPAWLVGVCLIWGFAVVADSAQFSACISELCLPELTGTALTLQTGLGFLLTLITIRMVLPIEHLVGWRWAFSFLAIGPIGGILAMLALRRLPAAKKLAGGMR